MNASQSTHQALRRAVAGITGLSLVALGTAALATPAQAVDPDPTTAVALAAALAADPSVVTGASFVTIPPAGGTALATLTPLSGFPHAGDSFAILSSGFARGIYEPDETSEPEDRGGDPVRGDSDQDVTILRVDVVVPSGDNCLTGVDFRFLSDEYPTFVGSSFNDAFMLEIDHSTWSTSGSTITSPDNLAFDQLGNPVSINAAGAATMSASLAGGSTTGGSTRTLTASAPISPGAHALFFSIFDQGDHVLDSDVLLDNLTFGHVDDPATGCRPGVVAHYGTAVTAPAPTFTDGANPSYTIPSSSTVAYEVDGSPVAAGTYPGDPGSTVTVIATPVGDDYITGPSQWNHTFPGGAPLTPVSTVAPTFTDPAGTAGDTVTIPAVTGVDYALYGEVVPAGTYPASGYTDVAASPQEGYALEGATYFSHVFTDSEPQTTVSAPPPTADLAAGSYTIPASSDVSYSVNGDDTAAGTYPGAGTVDIFASPFGEAQIDGPSVWSFTFPGSDVTVVEAPAPDFVDPTGGPGSVTIPDATGVNYLVNGEPVTAGSHPAAGPVIVTAQPQVGYALNGVTGWSHTFQNSASSHVTPEAPTFTDPPGTAQDTFTIPSQVGVRYVYDGDVIAAGVHAVDPASPDVTIQAVAASGYTLSGTTVFSHTFVGDVPPLQVTAAPTVSGSAVQGAVLTAHDGTWNPASATLSRQWLRDGAPVPGATGPTFTLTGDDVGHRLSVAVTAAQAGYASATATSAETGVVAGLLTTKKPSISGKEKVGKKLTAHAGSWSPSGLAFTYKWFRASKAIKGAHGSKYKLKKADEGKKLRVKVTGAKSGYVTASRMSGKTGKIH